MINFKKVVGFTALMLAAVVLTSLNFSRRQERVASEIWSSPQAALPTGQMPTGDISAMQGTSEEMEVDYDRIIPLNHRSNADLAESFDSSVELLDQAMQESNEIMRSLKTGSAACLDDGLLREQGEDGLCIDDFEMQKIPGESGGISSLPADNVIAEVDIALPVARRLRKNYSAPISDATMKVVEVLLRYGMDDRALSVLEEGYRNSAGLSYN